MTETKTFSNLFAKRATLYSTQHCIANFNNSISNIEIWKSEDYTDTESTSFSSSRDF